uniref:Glycosyltransferase n=1 Tax=Nelumbo nucifera TaxID=4432 RepID=A0A822Z2L1_NELNU|nr:TPA_asm: hypothetical protein HUJ06_014977 [Nelumbo nucifera]
MASRPTALIVDLFCTDAFDVADELGIPKYVYITSSARLLALSLYLPTLDQEIEGEYVDLQEPIHVPGCKPVPVDDIVDPMLDRTNEQYAWYLAHASRYALAQGILLNSTEDLEPETLKALREDPVLRQISKAPIYPVGPIVRSLDEFTGQEEKECLAWLDEQPTESVLYVSLGSGGTLSNEQLTEFALGLELSQKRFVWVVRPPARKETAASFFTSGNVSCGPSKYLPEGFMTRIKGRGFFVNTWGPQTAILRHASIGGFLCHCGWNSTLESIANGVPVIAWPLYAEQRLNATMLTEDWGMAIRTEHLPTKRLIGREEIGRLVQLVLGSGEGKALRSRARELQISALRAMGDGGSVHNSLSQFVRDCEMSLERSQQEKTPKSKEKC